MMPFISLSKDNCEYFKMQDFSINLIEYYYTMTYLESGGWICIFVRIFRVTLNSNDRSYKCDTIYKKWYP